MRTALRLRGLEAPSEALLFGLGGSPWYHFQPGEGAEAGVLRGLHPDRVKHSFYGLNIWSVRFNDLSREATGHLRARAAQGLQTIVLVDRRSLHGETPIVTTGADYALLVTAAAAESGPLMVQGPRDPEPWPLAEADLLRGWFRPRGGVTIASYFWHPVVELHWSPAAALRRALGRIVHQMTHHHPTLGPSGLPGLARFTQAVADGATSALEPTARLALEDGGESFHRDLTADFLRQAEQPLEMTALAEAAAEFEHSARLWRELLPTFLTPPQATHSLVTGLREILQRERRAIEALASLPPARVQREVPCLV